MAPATLADRYWEKIGGICLIAAPLTMAISSPLWFNDAALVWAGVIQMYAAILYIPAIFALARLVSQAAPRLAVLGGLAGLLGCVGAINFGTFGAYLWAAGEAGADAATLSAIEQIANEQLILVLNLIGLAFPLTFIILSVGLFLTGVAPRWVAVLLGISAICFPLGRIPDVQILYHVSDVLMFIPLGWIGLRTLIIPVPSRAAVPATA